MDLLTSLTIAILSFVILIVLTAFNLKFAASLQSGRRRRIDRSKSKDDENEVLDELSNR